jgi:hypothetical protein
MEKKFRTTWILGDRPTLTGYGEPLPADWELFEAPRPIAGTLAWRGEWGGIVGAWFYTAISPTEERAEYMRDVNKRMDASHVTFVTRSELAQWSLAVLLPTLIIDFGDETAARDYLQDASEREIWSSYLDHAGKE